MINGEKGALNPTIEKSHQTYFGPKRTHFLEFTK
jgi:hypothetical protein